MKKDCTRYIILAVSAIGLIFVGGFWGVAFGKEASSEEFKKTNNELSYDIDDLEGVWRKYSYDPVSERNSSILTNFRKTGKDRFDVYTTFSNRDGGPIEESKWHSWASISDVFYNKPTRTIKYTYQSNRYGSYPKEMTLNIGEDFNVMSQINIDDDNDYRFETILVRLNEEELNMPVEDIDTHFEKITGLEFPKMYKKTKVQKK